MLSRQLISITFFFALTMKYQTTPAKKTKWEVKKMMDYLDSISLTPRQYTKGTAYTKLSIEVKKEEKKPSSTMRVI